MQTLQRPPKSATVRVLAGSLSSRDWKSTLVPGSNLILVVRLAAGRDDRVPRVGGGEGGPGVAGRGDPVGEREALRAGVATAADEHEQYNDSHNTPIMSETIT